MAILNVNGRDFTSLSDPSLGAFLYSAMVNGYPAVVNGQKYNITQFAPDKYGTGPGGAFLVNGCPLNVVFGAGWQAGQQEALSAAGISCSMSPNLPNESTPVRPVVVASSPTEGIGNTGSTRQGGGSSTVDFSSGGGGNSNVNSVVAAAIAPSLTPGTPGALPTGATVGQTFGTPLTTLYRFILNSAPGRYDTGANYNGCSAVNSAMCDPKQFATLSDAIAYANSRGEIPYQVSSASEVWALIDGNTPIQPAQLLNSGGGSGGLMAIGLGAVALYLLLK